MGFERGVILALVRRPVLFVEAVRAWFAMRRRGGLLPASSYLDWRHFTAYGDQKTTASAQDVVNYLRWRRETRTVIKWGRVA